MVVAAFVNNDVLVLVLLLLLIHGQNSEGRCCGWHWKVTLWVSCRAWPKLGEFLDLLYSTLVPVIPLLVEWKGWWERDAFWGVFWLNIAKFEVNWCYRYCFNLFSNLRKENELRQYHYRNSTKVGERKIKSRREKFFVSTMILSRFLLPIPAAQMGARSVSARKENQMMWKNFLAIVAMPLPKMGGKKNSLRQWHCWNKGYKFLAIVAIILPK